MKFFQLSKIKILKPFNFMTSKKRKPEANDYREVCNQITLLDARKATLNQIKMEMEAAQVFVRPQNKNFKNNHFDRRKSEFKQTDLITFFKQDPQKIAASIMMNIFETAWNILAHEESDKKSNDIISPLTQEPKKIKVLNRYPQKLKKEAIDYLNEYGLHATFLYYGRVIPRSTLHDWSKVMKSSQKPGRKTPFELLEDYLFTWFLIQRARKLPIRDTDVQKKALIYSKRILLDEEILLKVEEKTLYENFSASAGWLDKFKQRHKICSRFFTTVCTKSKEDIVKALTNYFEELNNKMKDLRPNFIYNMDETAIFMELNTGHTLELKSKKVVSRLSSGKEKERFTLAISACSNGSLLPPFVIFKTAKPKGKTDKDYPSNEIAKLDPDVQKALDRLGGMAVQNYSGWNTKRIMKEYYIPFYAKTSHKNSLLVMDNHSSHVCQDTTNELDKKEINYIFLAPNTTPITQPIDINLTAAIKSKIKKYFHDWLIDNEDKVITYNEKKKKYKFISPTKSLIMTWILKAYEELDARLVAKSKQN